jgi:hypothetical protein
VCSTQDLLGHASIVLTADTYLSVTPDLALRAAEDVARLIAATGRIVPGTRRRRTARPRLTVHARPSNRRSHQVPRRSHQRSTKT